LTLRDDKVYEREKGDHNICGRHPKLEHHIMQHLRQNLQLNAVLEEKDAYCIVVGAGQTTVLVPEQMQLKTLCQSRSRFEIL
jgi:hypothetical protein